MRKLLYLSVVLSTIAVPMLASRDADPVRGLRRALAAAAIFNVLYVVALALFIRSPF